MQKVFLWFGVLLSLVIFIFLPSPTFAGSEASPPCYTCEEWQYGLQIEYQECGTVSAGNIFDYEQGSNAGGYLAGQSVKGVVFKLCDCENVDLFSVEGSYGLKIEIVDPLDGVYFIDENISAGNYDTCQNIYACGPNSGNLYISSYTDDGCCPYCPIPCNAVPFAFAYESTSTLTTLYNPGSDSLVDCKFEGSGYDYRVREIRTSCTAPFMEAQKPILLIDMPTFIYDPQIVLPDFKVTVKVTIFDESSDLCSCIIDVGNFIQTVVLSGTVKDYAGVPVVGAYIDVYGGQCFSDRLQVQSKSDVSGSYQVTVPANHSYYLHTSVSIEDSARVRDEWWTETGGATYCDGAEPVTVTDTDVFAKDFNLDQVVPEPSALLVTPGLNNVDSTAETLTLSVDTSGDNYMSWSAASNNDWLSFPAQPVGVGDGTFSVDVEANDGLCRTGTVVVTAPEAVNSPLIVTVNQMAPGISLVAPQPVIKSAGLASREKPDGSKGTIFYMYLSGPSPVDILSCIAKGPNGEIYDLHILTAIRQRGLLYMGTSDIVVGDGAYTFEVLDSSGRKVTHNSNFTYTDSVPHIDESKRWPVTESYVGTTTPSLGFVPPAGDNLKYRFYIMDEAGMAIWSMNVSGSESEMTVPEGLLQPNTAYLWFVRVFDESLCNVAESERNSFYTNIPAAELNLDTVYVVNFEIPTHQLTLLGVRNLGIAPWDIDLLTATDPDGNEFDLYYNSSIFNKPSRFVRLFSTPFPASDGNYLFALESGSTFLDRGLQYTRNSLPFFDDLANLPVDNVYIGLDKLTFSWKPLYDPNQPNRVYYYRVRITSMAGIVWYDSPLTTDNSIVVPVAGNLTVGNSYRWSVLALDRPEYEMQNYTMSSARIFTVNDAPIKADYSCNAEVLDAGLNTINFSDKSFGNIASWHWDFGDGTSSEERNPVHHFNSVADRTVTLKIEGFYSDFDSCEYYFYYGDVGADGDVDGLDLVRAVGDLIHYDLEKFAQSFGHMDD